MVTTFTFTVFIYAVIFNSLNTRSNGFNVFEHIGENKKFSIVMISIAVVQSLIIQFGGKVFSTVHGRSTLYRCSSYRGFDYPCRFNSKSSN